MEMNIKYYKCIPVNEIKTDVKMTSRGIESTFTYPNGFVLETVLTGDGATDSSN